MGTELHFRNSSRRINTSATTVVQSAGNPGVLDGIAVGIAGTAGNVITAQNSAGTVVFAVDGANRGAYTGLNLKYTDGLTVVSSAATAPDFVVLYR